MPFKLYDSLKVSSVERRRSQYRYKNKKIDDVATVFANNLDRAASLPYALLLSVRVGVVWKEMTAKAQKEYKSRAKQDIKDHGGPKIVKDKVAQHALSREFHVPVDEHFAATIDAAKMVDRSSILDFHAVNKGINALYTSMLVQCWTAIEVMATDLWEAAVNVHPKLLADLSGKGWHDNKPTNLATNNAANIARKKKKGSYLRDKLPFASLKSIKQAYGYAFSMDETAIKTALMSPDLHFLSETRHILVHKGGKPDRKFKAAIKGHALARKIAKADRISVDGEKVTDLLTRTINPSFDLLKAVDDWIDKHL